MNLSNLVDQLTVEICKGPKKEIVNDINPCLASAACANTLRKIMGDLLRVCCCSAGKEIKIAARTFHHLILLQIKYHDARIESVIEQELEPAKSLAESLGGCLYITSNNMDKVTISFTFLHQPLPAAVVS